MIFKFIKISNHEGDLYQHPLECRRLSRSNETQDLKDKQIPPSAPNFAAICTLYVYSLSTVNLIIGFHKTQYINNKSPPRIGEGRIIKGPAMATFCRDRQLSTDYGNDQFRHAILNKASWVMRFSSKWLVFKVPFFALTVHINAFNRLSPFY